jgi:hypothetical protein
MATTDATIEVGTTAIMGRVNILIKEISRLLKSASYTV